MICVLVFLIATTVVVAGRSQRRSRTCQHDHDASFDRLVDRSLFILYHKTRGDGWSCILFKTKFKRIWSDNDLSCTWDMLFLFDVPLAMGIYDHISDHIWPKKADLEKSVTQVEIFDTGVAFLAGLMIVPAVFCILKRRFIHACKRPIF